MLDGFSLDNVPDPSDFPLTSPGLRQLDDALRCRICGELFEAPMTVNCPSGHCFCSTCIREYLLHRPNPTCPQCASSISEGQLRKNQTVEDIVRSWSAARSYVLNLVRRRTSERDATPVRESSTSRATSATLETPSKKRKASESADEDIIEILRPKKPKSRSASKSVVPDKDQDDEGALVACPICGKEMPNGLMFDHIDGRCASPASSDVARVTNASSSKAEQKAQWSRVFSEGSGSGSGSGSKGKGKAKATLPPIDETVFDEPLPKVAYDTQPIKRVRQLLREQGLSDAGDKPTLVSRHEHWVIIFNANRDASPAHRKSLKQLRAELERWEKAVGDQRGGKRRAQAVDAVAHQETHKAMFKQLTEAARRTAGWAGRKDVDGLPVAEGTGSGAREDGEHQSDAATSEAPPTTTSSPDPSPHEQKNGDGDEDQDVVLIDR